MLLPGTPVGFGYAPEGSISYGRPFFWGGPRDSSKGAFLMLPFDHGVALHQHSFR